jgi:sialate O-acetylesterase
MNDQSVIDKFLSDQYHRQFGHGERQEFLGNTDLPANWEWSGLYGWDGTVVFRKSIELTELPEQPALLSLGKINGKPELVVNGKPVQLQNDQGIYRTQLEVGLLGQGKNEIRLNISSGGVQNEGVMGPAEDIYLKIGRKYHEFHRGWQFAPAGGTMNYQTSPSLVPSLLYNAMIHPIQSFNIRGVIWYQGESNASQAWMYRQLFPLLIRDWRQQWEEPEMPFLFVQLTNFMQPDQEPSESNWAELREAQAMALDLPATGMAVAIDIGDAEDIHPRNKQEVGRRLALEAQKIAYNEDILSRGPTLESMQIDGDKVRLTFDHTGDGLKVMDKYGYLQGFAVAGPDRVFHWARAEVIGNQVIVHASEVKEPVAVRYAWGNNPDQANLYNSENLPAAPFRTDDWPMITAPK